ncbi:MAG: hypothetical protein KDD82_10525 [Planctomycetes bacterium]|nr:hypothetical protein [Planctomycetota bacterium]
MNCAEFRDLLNPFLDSELEVEQNVACLKHVELCTACAARAEHERALLTKLVGATRAPLSDAARAELFAGVFARVDAEDSARGKGGGWRRWALACAASVLLALGGAWFVHADPLCLWGCTTLDLLLQAQARMEDSPQTLDEVEQLIHRQVECPELVGSEVSGCQALVSEGCPCHPLVRYSLPDTDEVCFVALPGGHGHVGQERLLPDGRRYFVGAQAGLRFVGWRRPDGALAVCMPKAESPMPDEKLYVLAAALRGP